jgi:hypothetical protein
LWVGHIGWCEEDDEDKKELEAMAVLIVMVRGTGTHLQGL